MGGTGGTMYVTAHRCLGCVQLRHVDALKDSLNRSDGIFSRFLVAELYYRPENFEAGIDNGYKLRIGSNQKVRDRVRTVR